MSYILLIHRRLLIYRPSARKLIIALPRTLGHWYCSPCPAPGTRTSRAPGIRSAQQPGILRGDDDILSSGNSQYRAPDPGQPVI